MLTWLSARDGDIFHRSQKPTVRAVIGNGFGDGQRERQAYNGNLNSARQSPVLPRNDFSDLQEGDEDCADNEDC
jgi:hypothetical protein